MERLTQLSLLPNYSSNLTALYIYSISTVYGYCAVFCVSHQCSLEFLKTLQIPIDPAEQIITQLHYKLIQFHKQTGCTTVLEAFFTYR